MQKLSPSLTCMFCRLGMAVCMTPRCTASAAAAAGFAAPEGLLL